MPLTLTRVHVAEKVPGSDQSRVTRTNHYIRVYAEDGPPMYIQNGSVYSEGGPLVDPEDYPTWFWTEASKCTEHALATVHFTIPDDKVVVPSRDTSAPKRRNRK